MYCRFCGTEISNQSRFCSSCEKPQDLPEKTAANIWPMVLCYIIGFLFIIGGILPYLLQENLEEYYYHLSLLYAKYNYAPTAISAISCFTKFSSFLSPLFNFSSSVLAIYIGLLLIKKNQKSAVPVIVCSVVHILSIIYSGVINLLIYCAPTFVLSLYTNEESIISTGAHIINSEPDMLYYYQDNAICRLIISVIVIALAIVFHFIKKRYMNTATNDNTNISSIGGIIMIMSISVLSVVSTVLSAYLVERYESYVAANSVANLSFDLNIRFAVIFMFIIVIGIAVLFTRIKQWILALPTISIITILGVVAFIFSNMNMLIKDLDNPEEIFEIASKNFIGLIISSAFILIAMFYWFSSISRNKIPMWLQIALPISLPIIYIGIEIISNITLHLNSGISSGMIVVALTTIIVSLVVSSNKQSKL